MTPLRKTKLASRGDPSKKGQTDKRKRTINATVSPRISLLSLPGLRESQRSLASVRSPLIGELNFARGRTVHFDATSLIEKSGRISF